MKLHEFFPNNVPASSNLQIGYLESNHKCWIFEERDLSVMYDSFEPGSKITLWCDGICNARTDNAEPYAKRRKTATKSDMASSSSEATDNVDRIFKELNIQTWKTQN